MARQAGLTLERLRKDGEASAEEMSREYYQALAGLKPELVIQPIYDKYALLQSPEALEFTRDLFASAAAGSEDHRRARILLEWIAGHQGSRLVAPLEEREALWESTARVHVPDGTIVPFERAPIEIGNEADRARRTAIHTARGKLVESELAPMKRERLERERDFIVALGLADGFNASWEALSGIALGELRRQCEQFIADTQPLWDDVYPEFVKRELRIDPREATRADALALFRASGYDAYFPAREMQTRVLDQVRAMGIDPLANGRIRLDTEEREGKRSRAFCSPVRVPAEVYLVLRPHGGQTDWSTFLHELGHALHFAYVREDYPFEYRSLGDNSVTEAYAMLFDGLMEDRGWLARYTDLGAPKVKPFLRTAGFQELHYVRRYCAKLIYESQLYGGAVPWSSAPDLYVDVLGRATNFRYDASDAFVDVDSGYYAARYLRAWQLQSLIGETLTTRFDEDWWRNPRAGPWLVEQLFAEGQRELAHEQATRISGRGLSFAPLARQFERMLG